MQPLTEVLIYFDGIVGEAKRGLLLKIDPLGYFKIKVHREEGDQISLLPISRTFLVAVPTPAAASLEIPPPGSRERRMLQRGQRSPDGCAIWTGEGWKAAPPAGDGA